jgi:hypothetical protein
MHIPGKAALRESTIGGMDTCRKTPQPIPELVAVQAKFKADRERLDAAGVALKQARGGTVRAFRANGASMPEIAVSLGVTAERARQILLGKRDSEADASKERRRLKRLGVSETSERA